MLIDLFFYLFITPIHLLLAIIGSIIGLVLRPFHLEYSKKVIKGSWLLMSMLVVTGFLLTECWSRHIFGQYYEHHDYFPGIDCSPFWLNPQYGTVYFHGMTKHTLFALWGLYALLCWGTAAAITFWIMNKTDMKHERTIGSRVPSTRCRVP